MVTINTTEELTQYDYDNAFDDSHLQDLFLEDPSQNSEFLDFVLGNDII